jgi:sec-independent protein translocase protein TatC
MFDGLRPHLVELRLRLGISVLSVFLFFIIAFVFHEPILDWVVEPLNDAITTNENQSKLLEDGKVTTHQVGGAFFVAIKVSFFAGLIFAMPIILWQLWLFIAPGLYANEKRMLVPFVFGGSIMFAVGALFAYYVVTPFGFTFLIAFGSSNFIPYINIEDYVGFFTNIMIGFGIAFELPIFILFLALLGLVTDASLKAFFKYAVLIIFVVAALLTPPDIITQLLMAGPLVLLYGVSILIASIVNPESKEDN